MKNEVSASASSFLFLGFHVLHFLIFSHVQLSFSFVLLSFFTFSHVFFFILCCFRGILIIIHGLNEHR